MSSRFVRPNVRLALFPLEPIVLVAQTLNFFGLLLDFGMQVPRDTQRDESKQATILRGVTTVLRGGRTEKWSGKAR